MIVVDNKKYNNRDFKPFNYFLFSNAQYFLPSCRNFIPVSDCDGVSVADYRPREREREVTTLETRDVILEFFFLRHKERLSV